jgi:hypothetical protein
LNPQTCVKISMKSRIPVLGSQIPALLFRQSQSWSRHRSPPNTIFRGSIPNPRPHVASFLPLLLEKLLIQLARESMQGTIELHERLQNIVGQGSHERVGFASDRVGYESSFLKGVELGGKQGAFQTFEAAREWGLFKIQILRTLRFRSAAEKKLLMAQ